MILAALGAVEIAVGVAAKRAHERKEAERREAAKRAAQEERRVTHERRRKTRGRGDDPMTEAQWTTARRLALFRDIAPGVITTRAERHAAIERILRGATRTRAAQVIAKLRACPPAPYKRWEERTPRFAVLHARQVARIRGEDAPSDYYTLERYRQRYGWTIPCSEAPAKRVVPVAGPLTADDAAMVDAILGKRSARPTAQELRDYAGGLDTREDPVWGRVVVGGSL